MLEPAQIRDLTELAHSLQLEVLGESHHEKELEVLLETSVDLLGVNARDLRDFHTSLDLSESLIRLVPKDRIAVAESAIVTKEDILRLRAAGAKGFLIGETLMKSGSPGKALRSLC